MSAPSVEYPEVRFPSLEDGNNAISLAEDALKADGVDVKAAAIDFPAVDPVDTAKLIEEFRRRLCDVELEDYLLTDPELLRWLKARSYDLTAAEEMLRNSLKWERENGIDEILEWKPPPQMIKDFPFQICGFDNDGDQFGVITYSKWNIQSLIESMPIDRGQTHIRYFWQCLEMVKKIMRANSTQEKAIYSGIVIIDMDGLAISQFASKDLIEVVLEATRQYEANYPGFLKKAIVVNTPKVFTILYSLMRPFLSLETQASVEIYGYYDDWRGTLRGLVPVDQLPSRHGGANTVVKPYLQTGSYVVKVPEFDAVDERTLQSTVVPAGQKLDLDFVVTNTPHKLSWAFKTDDYDIAFGLFHVGRNENAENEIVDLCRVDSHAILQRGFFDCQEAGKYIFRFDNTSSWIRPKTLYYFITES